VFLIAIGTREVTSEEAEVMFGERKSNQVDLGKKNKIHHHSYNLGQNP
jgi:hypothetical protein